MGFSEDISPSASLQALDHKELAGRFLRVRKQTEHLCETLETEDYVVQPIVDVSPPKWHLGHTTWFFENFILKEYKQNYEVFHPEYSYLFNSYYVTVGDRWDRPKRGMLTRPTVEEVYAYRKHVTEHMIEFLLSDIPDEERVRYILTIGLQHEQQHQELMVYDIKCILGNNPLQPVYRPEKKVSQPAPKRTVPAEMLEMPEGLYEIGAQGKDFAFDNEYGFHKVYLEPYRIANRLVTNGEYMEFIESGAYKTVRLWLSDGWDWVEKNNPRAPMYWYRQDGEWWHYTMNGPEKVKPEEPVTHISYYEANAYALYRGMRLPTEFEWEAACKKYQPIAPEEANFVDSGNFRPTTAREGNYQFFGDAWEWTQSAYLPYPYYECEDGALGEYNGKFMINQMVLRGGSCATSPDHIRVSYRNFFHPHLRWHFTGIRLAENIK
ncbi:ergothioneine biosynthesis protein EgtB [Roseivirga sp. BDSF3-8]|uniref:ergothioneine biosynthesis protein EgtB n=1 Tax=Roseivirga sp. BDSF3-8 TaxID=3241598 RepID=UPI0035327B8F